MIKRSGWLVPLAVFVASACASSVVLVYYFAFRTSLPAQERPVLTDSTRSVAFSLGNAALHVPANYIPLPSVRRGGPVKELGLIAILPNLRGYSLDEAQDFTANDSRIVALTLRAGQTVLPEQDQFDQLYAEQMQDPEGQEGPFGLKQYEFREGSAYRAKDLLVGTTDNGRTLLLCGKITPENMTPSCLRVMPLMHGFSLTYRFKRAQLSQWQSMDAAVRGLIAAFAGVD